MTKKEKFASIITTVSLIMLILSCWYTIIATRPDFISAIQNLFQNIFTR